MRPELSLHLAVPFFLIRRQPPCDNSPRSPATHRLFSVGFFGRGQNLLAILSGYL